MSTQLKLISTFLFLPVFLIAQPKSGVTIGLNQTFCKKTDLFEFQSKTGFNIGYIHNINLSGKWDLSLGSSFSRNNLLVKPTQDLLSINSSFVNGNKSTNYFNVPISINYSLKSIFLFSGYQYSHSIGNNTLLSNTNNHSLIGGIGINTRFIGLSISFINAINQESQDTGYINFYNKNSQTALYNGSYPKNSHKLSVLKFTVTIPLKKSKPSK